MEWIKNFYSITGEWWGPAESEITDLDHARVALIRKICPDTNTVLELGSGYGGTAAVTADSGYHVTACELGDRIKFSDKFVEHNKNGQLKFIQGDFYTTNLGSNYDVVTYWNGFGIGSDEDQRKLLRRIASEWLKPGGRALVDIGNPLVRSSWAGEKEHKDAKPESGYNHSINQFIDYDPVNNRFVDTWWEDGDEENKLTQTLRNYTPADLKLLLEGTGLKLQAIYVGGVEIDIEKEHTGNKQLLKEEQEYLAVLVLE